MHQKTGLQHDALPGHGSGTAGFTVVGIHPWPDPHTGLAIRALKGPVVARGEVAVADDPVAGQIIRFDGEAMGGNVIRRGAGY